MTCLLELTAFKPIPVVCHARRVEPENYWKRSIIPDRAYPAIKSANFQRLVPGDICPDPIQLRSGQQFKSQILPRRVNFCDEMV